MFTHLNLSTIRIGELYTLTPQVRHYLKELGVERLRLAEEVLLPTNSAAAWAMMAMLLGIRDGRWPRVTLRLTQPKFQVVDHLDVQALYEANIERTQTEERPTGRPLLVNLTGARWVHDDHQYGILAELGLSGPGGFKEQVRLAGTPHLNFDYAGAYLLQLNRYLDRLTQPELWQAATPLYLLPPYHPDLGVGLLASITARRGGKLPHAFYLPDLDLLRNLSVPTAQLLDLELLREIGRELATS